jgi:malonyl-CoA decarboxylase
VAIFYSINSTQRGLANIDLGNLLIKQAARILLAQHPSLTNLLTLSPLPGFRSWLITQLQRELPQVTWPVPHGSMIRGVRI